MKTYTSQKGTPYRKARLVKTKGKRPRIYVEFHAWDTDRQELVRARDYSPEKQPPHLRAKHIEKVMRQTDAQLYLGWVLPRVPKEEKQAPITAGKSQIVTLRSLLQKRVDLAHVTLRKRTWESYRAAMAVLLDYLEARGQGREMKAWRFDQKMAGDFADWVILERKCSPRTRNNYISFLRTIFNDLVAGGDFKENPFLKLKKLRIDKVKSHRVFSPEERAKLSAWLKEHDRPLWIFSRAIYYTFLRPLELSQLRVRDLDLKQRLIHVGAEIAKNRKGEIVDLYPDALEMFSDYMAEHPDAGREDFLLGSKGRPGLRPIGESTMGHRHKAALEICGMGGKDFTLYSWKHTGVCEAYLAGMDLKTIQALCRHATADITDKYLRGLALARAGRELKVRW